MSELYPSDSDLTDLSGTSDAGTGVAYPTIGESPYYTSFYKMLSRLLDVARLAGSLRVFKDGDLTFGVRAGRYIQGGSAVSFAEATAQALTNNQTNYVYLNEAGAVAVSTSAFPAAAVWHLPLATIATGSASSAGVSGKYDAVDIVDYRGKAVFHAAFGAGLEASTAGSGAANVLTAAESGKVLTNEGATAKNYHTLPTAVAGLAFTFIVQDADGLRIVAAAGDTIRINTSVSAAAGYAESTAIGSAVVLVAVNATEWIAISSVGTWSVA